MKTCEGCRQDKAEEEFYWRNKAKGIRQNFCKECKSRYNKTWYAKHAEAHKANVARNGERYKEAAYAIILAAKSVPCMDCGRTFPPVAMDFDHVNGVKLRDIAHMTKHSLGTLRTEIAKCEVVCACCHRIRTATRLGLMDKALVS